MRTRHNDCHRRGAYVKVTENRRNTLSHNDCYRRSTDIQVTEDRINANATLTAIVEAGR